MIEQSSGNDNINSSLTQFDSGRLIYGQLLSSTDVDVFKFLPNFNGTLEDGVGFTASIRITEDFSAQAGWKFSLIDSDENIIASIDSNDVDDFPATGQLQLSGSYDVSKALYVKVETSATDAHSAAQYELLLQEHNQIDEEAVADDYASLQGDIASYSNFEKGAGVEDVDTFVFETLDATAATTANIVYTAMVDLSFTAADGSSILDVTKALGDEVDVAGNSFFVEYSDVDSDTIALTLRRADGSFVKDASDNDINTMSVDLNTVLAIKVDPATDDTTDLTVTAASPAAISATVRTLDGAVVAASDGTLINSLSVDSGTAVEMSLASVGTGYVVELTSAMDGSYSLQVDGLAARQNPVPTIQVKDYVSGDIEDGLPDYSNLPVIQVDKNATLNLAEIFEIGDSSFANMYFFSADATPLTGIGASNNATTIAAADYAVGKVAQERDLSAYSVGDEFQIMGFADNTSLLAANASYADQGQYNTSGIIGAKIVISNQGISGSVADASIREGETTTLTVQLSQALTGSETLEVNLTNASGDLLFDNVTSKSVVFSSTVQSVDVVVEAVSGDIDFADSEAVGIQITPVTAAYQNLLVSDVALTVTEIIPSFSMVTNVLSVVNATDYYKYTVTLDNASDFAAGNPVSVAITAPSGFAVSTSTDIADAVTSVDFSSTNDSATWYVLADTTAKPDGEILNSGLTGQIVHAVTYGSKSLAGLDTLTVTRAVDDATSDVNLAGTSGDDTIATTAAQENITSLAGNDTVTYAAVADMDGDSFDGGDGTDTVVLPGVQGDYTAETLLNNSYNLTVTASGEVLGISNVEQITFSGDSSTINASDLNQDPTLQAGVVPDGGYSLLEGTSQVIDLSGLFVDPEGDDLYFAYSLDGGAVPSWVQFNAVTQELTLAPGASDPDVYTFAISAADSVVASADDASTSFVITVTDIPNVATAVADQTVDEDAALSVDVSAVFSDADIGDVLTLSAAQADGTDLPTWLAFDASTGLFTGTPDNDAVGTMSIAVTATDLALNSITDNFDITVSNTNDSPVLSATIDDVVVIQDTATDIDLSASFDDVDANDSLTYSATLSDGSDLPAWLSLDTSTGVLSASPGVADLGDVSVTVTAEDIFNATATDTFDVTARSPSVNVSGTILDRNGNAMEATTDINNSADSAQLHSANASAAGAFGFDVDPGLDIDVAVYQAYDASNNAISVYDALDALKISIGLDPAGGPVTAMQLIAADIDQNGEVSVYDALDILKTSIGLATNSPPEWVFVDASADLSGLTKDAVSYTEGGQFTNLSADVTIDLTGILIGDVDGSYTPDIV